jgi:hypothetical protein
MRSSMQGMGLQSAGRLQLTGLHYAARGHIRKLCTYYENFTIFQAVMYTTYCYFFHVRHANWPTITGWVLCHEKVEQPSLNGSINLKLSTWSIVRI